MFLLENICMYILHSIASFFFSINSFIAVRVFILVLLLRLLLFPKLPIILLVYFYFSLFRLSHWRLSLHLLTLGCASIFKSEAGKSGVNYMEHQKHLN